MKFKAVVVAASLTISACSSADRSAGVEIVSDVAASLHIDGQPMDALVPKQSRRLGLAPGQHIVAIVSSGGEAKWEQIVDIGSSLVELAPELSRTVEEVKRDYVRIPAGSFEMGCVNGDTQCGKEEKPLHKVTLSRDFWLMKTEVTVAAYKAFAKDSGKPMPEESDTNPGFKLEDHPIMNLLWYDAVSYCERSGGRLPTEAEWEYAARGGQAGARYVWGNEVTPMKDGKPQANVGDERAKKKIGCEQCGWFDGYDDGFLYTAPVGSFPPNGFGLHDMAGNVLEWTADFYREDSYAKSALVDPPGREFGRWRVLRGGSWSMSPVLLRLSYRVSFPPHRTTDNYGVRCARDVAVP